MEINILKLCDVVGEYCKAHDKAVIYYEVKYRTDEEKEKILQFYKNKISPEIYASLNKEDDNFIIFNNDEYAMEFAEETFPIKTYMDAIDSLYFIYAEVYSKNGSILWKNLD